MTAACVCPTGFLDFYSGIDHYDVALATSVDPYDSTLKVGFENAALRENWAFFDVPLSDGDVVYGVVQVRMGGHMRPPMAMKRDRYFDFPALLCSCA